MPGFIGVIGDIQDFTFCDEKRENLVKSTFKGEAYAVERRTVNKFLLDKIFSEDEDFLIITEGVILNRIQLEKKYNTANFQECIVTMYKQLGETFFHAFRGSFSGVFYDKKSDTWIVYTDHIGDKQVFYSALKPGILFGSEIGFLVETLKLNRIPVTLNSTGVYLALTHGFVIEDHTLIKEIKKLSAGHYLKYSQNRLEEIQYHRFSNKPDLNMTAEEAIEGIDKLFRNGVRLQFEKDKEYGFKHFTCLSGGLDSRMTVWVAHQMGYTDQLNTTFSQSNYLDFTIAQQIATDLQHDFLFKTLDHGNFIKDVDNITELTYGNTTFFGLSHGKSLYDMVNFKPYGIVHTGMIGDAIIGTFFKKLNYNREVKIGQGAYSQELIERLSDYKFKYEYENEEIFSLYTRAFTGANQGMLVFQEHTESVSPFCDVDFIEFCYSIPLKLRFNHKIYFDWILQKYPDAAEYIWEKKKEKITVITNKEPTFMNILGHKIPTVYNKDFSKWLIGAVLRRIGQRKKGEKTKSVISLKSSSMNPVDFWYENNNSLQQFIKEYWETYSTVIEDKQLCTDIEYIYKNCRVYDTLQGLSVLSAIKKIYRD